MAQEGCSSTGPMTRCLLGFAGSLLPSGDAQLQLPAGSCANTLWVQGPWLPTSSKVLEQIEAPGDEAAGVLGNEVPGDTFGLESLLQHERISMSLRKAGFCSSPGSAG